MIGKLKGFIDSYGEDYRYVRVCPDGDGRYRITG